MKKELKALVKKLVDQDWTVEYGGKHLNCKPPRGVGRPVHISLTPSKDRTWMNDMTRLKRQGAVL